MVEKIKNQQNKEGHNLLEDFIFPPSSTQYHLYESKVKNKITWGIIKQKYELFLYLSWYCRVDREYTSVNQFLDDIEILGTNPSLYLPADHPMVERGKQLIRYARSLM